VPRSTGSTAARVIRPDELSTGTPAISRGLLSRIERGTVVSRRRAKAICPERHRTHAAGAATPGVEASGLTVSRAAPALAGGTDP